MNTNYMAEAETEGEKLIENAQALLDATANITEEKVIEARRRLTEAVRRGKNAWNLVKEQAIAGARATDQVIREHPYQSIGIALSVGALAGFLLSRRS